MKITIKPVDSDEEPVEVPVKGDMLFPGQTVQIGDNPEIFEIVSVDSEKQKMSVFGPGILNDIRSGEDKSK